MPIRLTTYRKGNPIPPLPGYTIFNSTELFHVFELTRGYEPMLIVAYQGDRPVAKMLSVIRKSVRLFPPSIIKRCEIYGNGEYFDDELNREDLFNYMLEHLTREALQSSFLIEFRNLDNPLFGYKAFRMNGYFPINWLRVYNSLHSRTPMERLSISRKRQINKALKNGAYMEVADNAKDIMAFSKMLKNAYSSQVRKHFPDMNFFRLLTWQRPDQDMAKIFLVKYKDKIIGGSVCVFSNRNAYLWFSGGMRKSYALLYPGILSVWAALTYAYEKGYEHFEFMDPGLPFKKHGYRDFILRFGGKQSSTRRWFRFRWNWLNALLCRMYI
ncbi:GNAT family N-acetyltransferase [Phocaeicola sp.]